MRMISIYQCEACNNPHFISVDIYNCEICKKEICVDCRSLGDICKECNEKVNNP